MMPNLWVLSGLLAVAGGWFLEIGWGRWERGQEASWLFMTMGGLFILLALQTMFAAAGRLN